ncbi:MAG: ABC transporter ATP-binding protein [Dehalococcoidia bacterium]|nr:ABC transporter ATP-binding protein [Dehalococcoidia bacterium]
MTADKSILLEVQGLKKYFPVTEGLVFLRTAGYVKAVDDIDFELPERQTLGLVGESGCGKTTTARVILRLEEPTSGRVCFQGKDVSRLGGADLRRYRAAVHAVFQDPTSSLNPRMRVGSIISEPLEVSGKIPRSEIKDRVKESLDFVGLNQDSAGLFPHEFSGGQRQRVALARAFALRPRLIVLDEPVSSLDVSIRAQILNLAKDMQEQAGISFLLISHDLATVRYMSHRIAVMYLGKIVEAGARDEVYSHPLHPYTSALLSAASPLRPGDQQKEVVLTGEVSSPLNPPSGCRFHPRCDRRMKSCSDTEPQLKPAGADHQVACHLY